MWAISTRLKSVRWWSKNLGTWKSPAPYQLVLRKRDAVTATDQMIETPDKANAVFMAGMTLAMNQDDPDYPALMFANRMLGGDLKSRLWLRIREKEGFSYGVGSALVAATQVAIRPVYGAGDGGSAEYSEGGGRLQRRARQKS